MCCCYVAEKSDHKFVIFSRQKNIGTIINNGDTMRKTKKYQDYLVTSLKNPREAVSYLNAALEDGDPEIFLVALRNVAEAFGGLTALARKTKLNRVNLYRILSKSGNPELYSLGTLLKALGLRLAVVQHA